MHSFSSASPLWVDCSCIIVESNSLRLQFRAFRTNRAFFSSCASSSALANRDGNRLYELDNKNTVSALLCLFFAPPTHQDVSVSNPHLGYFYPYAVSAASPSRGGALAVMIALSTLVASSEVNSRVTTQNARLMNSVRVVQTCWASGLEGSTDWAASRRLG